MEGRGHGPRTASRELGRTEEGEEQSPQARQVREEEGGEEGREASRAEAGKEGCEKGQTLIEYALLVVLIAIVVIVALQLLGPQIEAVFDNIRGELGGAT